MKKLPLFLFAIPFFISAGQENSKAEIIRLKKGLSTIRIMEAPPGKKKMRMIPVDIYIPDVKKINGDILVLPGWKFSRMRWHRETELLKHCREKGFRAIFPEMYITNYESRYYRESRFRWAATPGGKWIREIFIPVMQKKYGMLRVGERNFLLGLSTGARGVLLVSLRNPGLFTAGASLSGDCNQVKMPRDRLMSGTYGPYNKYPRRWANVDNPENEAIRGNWKMPLYIGHGKRDKVSPFSQSLSLYRTLRKHYPDLKVKFNAPDNEGHTFRYWNSEIIPVLDFFLSVK